MKRLLLATVLCGLVTPPAQAMFTTTLATTSPLRCEQAMYAKVQWQLEASKFEASKVPPPGRTPAMQREYNRTFGGLLTKWYANHNDLAKYCPPANALFNFGPLPAAQP